MFWQTCTKPNRTLPIFIFFGSVWVGLDSGNSDNRANSVQPELELGLSSAIRWPTLTSRIVNTKLSPRKGTWVSEEFFLKLAEWVHLMTSGKKLPLHSWLFLIVSTGSYEWIQENAWIKANFRGNGFYTLLQKGIIVVRGRETAYGAIIFKLVLPNTLLYSRMAETFHRKFHDLGL